MATHDTTKRKVKTIETVFSIIETVQQLDSPRLKDITEHHDLAPSTIHNHLTTLEDMKYLVKVDGRYELGVKFLEHGMTAKRKYAIVRIAKPSLEQLAEETTEVVWIYVEEHGRAIPIHKETGERAVLTAALEGNPEPMHCTGAGKAMLAYYPPNRVEAIIDRYGLTKYTENTITERDAFFEELAEIRDRRYALNDCEEVSRVRAVSIPVIVNDTVHGAISVAGPKNRIKGEYFRRELPDLILGSVNEIELKLAHSDKNL